jgi:hypothetical protein
MASNITDRPAHDALGEMRHDRDRFVALAFSSADMLFELDRERCIVFAAGATGALLGAESKDLAGRNFADIATSIDRAMVNEALAVAATRFVLMILGRVRLLFNICAILKWMWWKLMALTSRVRLKPKRAWPSCARWRDCVMTSALRPLLKWWKTSSRSNSCAIVGLVSAKAIYSAGHLLKFLRLRRLSLVISVMGRNASSVEADDDDGIFCGP